MAWQAIGVWRRFAAARGELSGVNVRGPLAAVKHLSSMRDSGLLSGASAALLRRACPNAREKMLMTLVLYTLVRTGQAFAGDAAPAADSAARALDAHAARAPVPALISDPAVAVKQISLAAPISPSEFRPRATAPFEADAHRGGFVMDEPMLANSTVWQNLEQFRSADRVRLLTIWQTRASTVSLQADKHGGPSLQWSSPWMIRGRDSHGLLDRLFNVPARGAIASRGGAARPTPTLPPSKLPDLATATR